MNILAEHQTPEETLRESEVPYQLLVEQVKDYAIIMLDPEGHVITWNEGARRIKGYVASEIIGRDFACFYTAEDIARDYPKELLSLAARDGRFEDEGWRIRKDQSRFWADVVITALRDDAGKLRGYAKVTRDITERKQAEDAMAQKTQELARSNADLEQFAYVASHDLQEPLRMVASFTQLLAKRYQGKLDSEADEFIGYAVDGARRMQVLINDLLAYSRIGTRGKGFEPTNSAVVLETALGNLKAAIKESGAVVTHDLMPTVRADEGQLCQVLQNLIGNAIKFHGSDPPLVHVSAQRDNGNWRFSVRDNGIGINHEYVHRIFIVFQRLHTSAEYPGTGIGLAISKKIVERHGGRIWVESEPAKGSTFCFTLPRT
ncbi:MAG TPA: ATP-binding protein [Terriglobia bacterium]|nr:ATP-binding protein [Terriglobia bacterium]